MGEDDVLKKHKDLSEFIRAEGLRMTPSKRLLIQFFLDNKNKFVSHKELQDHVAEHLPDVDRTTLYRNLGKFVSLGIIQELNFPKLGKVFQYVFGRKVQHYYICKTCGKANRGNQELFDQIENSLKNIHGFSKADLSVMFYGRCTKCTKLAQKKSQAALAN